MCVYYMSHYVITKYSYDKAEELGLVIKVSRNSLKNLTCIKKIFFLQELEILVIKTTQTI